MSIANTVVDCLHKEAVPYEVIAHPRTASARETARSVCVPPDRVAKAVVLRDEGGYVMAVIPASRYVSVGALSRKLRRSLALAREDRLQPMFKDCERGAIPPLGPAYGLPTVVDDHLVGQPEVYFEAGDHEELIRVAGDEFLRLLKEARHGLFSH